MPAREGSGESPKKLGAGLMILKTLTNRKGREND
jgi:hypothetical protein